MHSCSGFIHHRSAQKSTSSLENVPFIFLQFVQSVELPKAFPKLEIEIRPFDRNLARVLKISVISCHLSYSIKVQTKARDSRSSNPYPYIGALVKTWTRIQYKPRIVNAIAAARFPPWPRILQMLQVKQMAPLHPESIHQIYETSNSLSAQHEKNSLTILGDLLKCNLPSIISIPTLSYYWNCFIRTMRVTYLEGST